MLDLNYEKDLFAGGFEYIGGIDEAGRGPLAGPVVAACVVLHRDTVLGDDFDMVKDSKKLTEKKREVLFDTINDNFLVGVGMCDPATIDRINILQASFLAMKKAIGSLKQKASYYLLDGKFPIPNISIEQEPIIKGDEQIFAIAAASIIAKVTRDRLMKEFHEKYPEYGFAKHKGYGTKAHMESLQKHGPCAIHRKSFAPVKNLL